jgi:hypothetical protein
MVGELLMLKLLTVALAGIATAVLARRIMGQIEEAKARVKAEARRATAPPQRLRQDPNTGVYYPAE